ISILFQTPSGKAETAHLAFDEAIVPSSLWKPAQDLMPSSFARASLIAWNAGMSFEASTAVAPANISPGAIGGVGVLAGIDLMDPIAVDVQVEECCGQ